MSTRVDYQETQCRTALNRVSGMDFRWSLNPYRGCVHGCQYCFARRFHAHFDLNAGDDFTSTIFVKTNVAKVLSLELSDPSWRREAVAFGTATDPYQPIEGKYRLTRSCLEAFALWRSPVMLITKGTMSIRDIDVLQELSRSTESTVCFSITTVDRELARKLEPGTPPPDKRLVAVERLAAAGVRAGVALAPVIPGITDSAENLEAVAAAAASHGARFLWASSLYLKPGTKEHFLGFLESEYPALRQTFRSLYPGAYAPKMFQSQLQGRVAELKERHGLVDPKEEHAKRTAERQLEMSLS